MDTKNWQSNILRLRVKIYSLKLRYAQYKDLERERMENQQYILGLFIIYRFTMHPSS